MMKLVILMSTAVLLLSSPRRVQSTEESGVQIRRCGRHLVETLSLVCEAVGGYYDPDEASKRALLNAAPAVRPVSNWLLSQSDSEAEEYRGRQARGIVDECCRKPCSMNDLAQYCNKK